MCSHVFCFGRISSGRSSCRYAPGTQRPPPCVVRVRYKGQTGGPEETGPDRCLARLHLVGEEHPSVRIRPIPPPSGLGTPGRAIQFGFRLGEVCRPPISHHPVPPGGGGQVLPGRRTPARYTACAVGAALPTFGHPPGTARPAHRSPSGLGQRANLKTF